MWFSKTRVERKRKVHEEMLNCMADTIAHCFVWQLCVVWPENCEIPKASLYNAGQMLVHELMHESHSDANETSSEEKFSLVKLSEQALPFTNGITPEELTSLESRVLEKLLSAGAQSIESEHRSDGSLWHHVTFAR